MTLLQQLQALEPSFTYNTMLENYSTSEHSIVELEGDLYAVYLITLEHDEYQEHLENVMTTYQLLHYVEHYYSKPEYL